MFYASGLTDPDLSLAATLQLFSGGGLTLPAALNGPQECVAEIRQRYKDRRDVLIEGLARAGWQVPAPNASMFVWAPLPPDFAAHDLPR